MKMWPLLVLAACAEPVPDVTVTPATSFDVIVGADLVQLYPHGDITGECEVRDAFVAPRTYREVGDIVSCDRTATTCLDQVTVDGAELAIVRPGME